MKIPNNEFIIREKRFKKAKKFMQSFEGGFKDFDSYSYSDILLLIKDRVDSELARIGISLCEENEIMFSDEYEKFMNDTKEKLLLIYNRVLLKTGQIIKNIEIEEIVESNDKKFLISSIDLNLDDGNNE